MSGMQPRTVGVFSHEEVTGDGLYKVIFLRGLRAAFPGAEITWMTTLGTVYAGPLRAVAGPPLLDRIAERCGIGASPAELLRMPPADLGPFDLLLDTQSLLWRTLSLWRVPHRRFRSAALHRRGLGGAPMGPHVLDRLFALLEGAVGRVVPRDLSPLPLPAPLVEAAVEALPGDTPRVVFAPGAGGVHKCWPLERFIALARMQVERGRVPVFLLGPGEAGWAERLRAEVPGATFPADHPAVAAAGGPSLLASVAFAARCVAGVANDCGGGHIIAASGTPLLSLFGPTRPERFRPVAARSALIRAAEFGGTEMAAIPVEPVAAALEALIGGRGRP
jgi:ADP-heptose:LPS heptosyltransferase